MMRSWLKTGVLVLAFATASASAADFDEIRRLADEGQRAVAISRLDDLLVRDPGDISARFLKGQILLDMGNLPAARETFADLTRRAPKLPEPYNNLAVIYAAEGDYDKARQALVTATQQAPDYAAAQINLGDLYVKLALESYRRALELNPADEASRAKLLALDSLFQH
ncbi:tetratricopeptide repeat protein [Plasticicumulans acidivorans]|uniref:Tetratricopeptide repeat protein n=1 Tax=Plasticicumulans acidivorans TaxID=886464 RepID=A0A317MSU7_9GAMM|nr:tetratricopeptide repeat protein [Plasticicumulans acidivorans]PWV59292.1 tetratricopeptide repeat protein [Plasticicumulans acidivorans]